MSNRPIRRQLINPHQHSDYSEDGAATIEQIIDRNVELGATHVAITEHGNLNSNMDLYTLCKKKKIKPILGIELYVESPFKEWLGPQFYKHFAYVEDETKRKAYAKKKLETDYLHLTVHFKDEVAYQYFCKLTPKMEERAVNKFGRKPMCTLDELKAISGHITIGSGCIGGMVQRWVVADKNGGDTNPEIAEQCYCMLRDIAGPGNFIVEVFPHRVDKKWVAPVYDNKSRAGVRTKDGFFENHPKTLMIPDGDWQRVANQFVLGLAQKYGDPVVISLDAHFARPEQKKIQDQKTGQGREAFKQSESYHITSTDDSAKVLKETLGVSDETIDGWVENSHKWASQFDNFKITTNSDRWVLTPAPSNFIQEIKRKIDSYGRMNWKDPVMVERLKKEIKVLFFNNKINLFGYFNDVEDVANYCRLHNMLINVRGCLVGDTLVRMANGSLKKLQDIRVGDKVISHTGNSRIVNGAHEYDVKGDLFEITTTRFSGTPDIMTGDHRVYAYKRSDRYPSGTYKDWNSISDISDKAGWHRIDTLNKGDMIFHPWIKDRRIVDIETVDLSVFAPKDSIISGDTIEYTVQMNKKNDLFSIKGLCKHIGVHPVYFRNVMIKKTKIPSKKYLNNIESSVRCCTGLSLSQWMQQYQSKRTVRVQRFIKFDNEFAYLIGKWIGDGWVPSDINKKCTGFAFNRSDADEINRTKSYFERIGCSTYLLPHKKKQLDQLYINCPIISSFFRSFFPNYKFTSRSKYLSEFKYLPDSKLFSLINGLISADGHIKKDVICIDSVSTSLVDDVREALLYLKVPSAVSQRDPFMRGRYLCRRSYKILFKRFFNPGPVEHVYDNGFFVSIRKINKIQGINKVYDISVDSDTSYVTSNFAVHNSAGGCLYLYLIGVSGINPLKHGLSFERFLTEGRILANTLPDSDMDLSDQERVFKYLEEKHGDKFCRISTTVLFKIKSAIKDAERAIKGGKVSDSTEKLCKLLPTPPQGTDSKQLALGYTDKEGTYHQGLVETNDKLREFSKKEPEIWELACEMMGLTEHQSLHACGVVIADKPVHEYCPIMMVGDTKVTGFPPKAIENAGLVKYDFLQVNTLLDMQTCLESIKSRTGITIDPWNLPDDERCWQQFAEGRTETVFQFDTPTVRPYLMSIKPRSLEDLAAITALCRPGTLQAPYGDGRTLAQVFVDRRQGEPVQYIHDDLEPIMRNTEGVQLFQEQTMDIFKVLAYYDDAKAETVRRGISKKDRDVLESCMQDLLDARLDKGWTQEQVKLLIEQIMASARYSFNKSHAISYAYMAYACMWLKINHPLDWWKATLSNADPDEIPVKFWRYVKDFTSHPNINHSGSDYQISGEKLISPFTIIKGIGDKSYQQLVANAPYQGLEHFVSLHLSKRQKSEAKSSVNTGTVYRLILAGALDDFFDPNDDLETKLFKFEKVKSEIKEEKQTPINQVFCGITDLDRYMFKKKILSTYSTDLREIMLPKIGGYKRGSDWILNDSKIFGRDGAVKISDWDDLDGAKTLAQYGCAQETEISCCAYIVHERPFKYKANTKQALEFTADVGGYYTSEVMWPPKDEDVAPFGYKDGIVILTYRVQRDRISVKKIVPVLSKQLLDKYSVV